MLYSKYVYTHPKNKININISKSSSKKKKKKKMSKQGFNQIENAHFIKLFKLEKDKYRGCDGAERVVTDTEYGTLVEYIIP